MKDFKQTAKMSHGGHYCWGGKVMKKAEGGIAKSKTEAVKKKISEDIISDDMEPSIGSFFRAPLISTGMAAANFYDKFSGAKEKSNDAKKKLKDMEDKDLDEKEYAYKRGGMAKGGKWIQGAIKKPGALKKSLGVPMDKPIPAAKLQKASKAPGKMGQRARLAMTLKGMK
jgi:hypothetical protein